jgi:hypothetical protein
VSALAYVASGVKVTLGTKADVENDEPLRGSCEDVGKIWAAVGVAERRRAARRATEARKRRSMAKRDAENVRREPRYEERLRGCT